MSCSSRLRAVFISSLSLVCFNLDHSTISIFPELDSCHVSLYSEPFPFLAVLLTSFLLQVITCPPMSTCLSLQTQLKLHLLREVLSSLFSPLNSSLTCLYHTFGHSVRFGLPHSYLLLNIRYYFLGFKECVLPSFHMANTFVPRSCSLAVFHTDNLPLALPTAKNHWQV